MQEHLQSLADYPLIQGGLSFGIFNFVEDFFNKALQSACGARGNRSRQDTFSTDLDRNRNEA